MRPLRQLSTVRFAVTTNLTQSLTTAKEIAKHEAEEHQIQLEQKIGGFRGGSGGDSDATKQKGKGKGRGKQKSKGKGKGKDRSEDGKRRSVL